jgi:hypothetical protein
MNSKIPHGIFTKARLIARGLSEADIQKAIREKLVIVRGDGTLQSRAPKIGEGRDPLYDSVREAVELPSGTTVQQIKDGKPVRRQIVKRNGSKYSVIDPDTKQIEDVDEKDLAAVDEKDDKSKPGAPVPNVVKESNNGVYRFTHPNARAVVVNAKNATEAYKKLQLTHEYYYHRDDKWKLAESEDLEEGRGLRTITKAEALKLLKFPAPSATGKKYRKTSWEGDELVRQPIGCLIDKAREIQLSDADDAAIILRFNNPKEPGYGKFVELTCESFSGQEGRKFSSYNNWKSTVKREYPLARFTGDKDIDEAHISRDHSLNGTVIVSVGEWDGEEGIIHRVNTGKKALADSLLEGDGQPGYDVPEDMTVEGLERLLKKNGLTHIDVGNTSPDRLHGSGVAGGRARAVAAALNKSLKSTDLKFRVNTRGDSVFVVIWHGAKSESTSVTEDTKYLVWVDEGEGAGWEEQGDGPLTLKQAERITREVKSECGCKAQFLPVGQKPTHKPVAEALLDGDPATGPTFAELTRAGEGKHRVNYELEKMTRNAYFDAIPLPAIAKIFSDNGLPTDALDGVYTGREGRVSVPVVDGLQFTMTWHKMRSGRYEIVAYLS